MELVNFKLLFCTCSQFLLTLTNPLAPNPVKLSIVNCSINSRRDVKFFSIPLPSSAAEGQFSTGRHSNHLVELSAKAQTSMAATSLNWSGNKAWRCDIKERPFLYSGPSPDSSSLPAGLGWRRGARARQRQRQPCCRPTLLKSCICLLYLFFVFVFAFWYSFIYSVQFCQQTPATPTVLQTEPIDKLYLSFVFCLCLLLFI